MLDHEDDAATDVDDVVEDGDAVDGDIGIIRIKRKIAIFTKITSVIISHIKSSIVISMKIFYAATSTSPSSSTDTASLASKK